MMKFQRDAALARMGCWGFYCEGILSRAAEVLTRD